MKPIKINIEINALDCYIYSGHIFIITVNGELLISHTSRITSKVIARHKEYESFLRLIYLRNDYLSNTQGKYFLEIPNLKNEFTKTWKKISKIDDILINLNEKDFTSLIHIPELPVYDIRAYAMRLYISTKKALYEIILSEKDGYKINISYFRKVFDQKIININAKCGELFLSAGNEGLFHGNFINDKNILQVNEKPIMPKSLKTNWSQYDIYNYSANNNFDYIINDISDNKTKHQYSKYDERPEKKSFKSICKDTISMSELLESTNINHNNILYCFNSSSQGFFYLKDGKFYSISLLKDTEKIENIQYSKLSDNKRIHFSSRKRIMPQRDLGLKRPISSQIVPIGCIIEYFDSIKLFQNNKTYNIESESAYSIRSYLSSIRYKNLATIVKDNFISIYSFYPFTEKYKPLIYSEDDTDFGDEVPIINSEDLPF